MMQWSSQLSLPSIINRIRYMKIQTTPDKCSEHKIKNNNKTVVHRILKMKYDIPKILQAYFGNTIECLIDDKTMFNKKYCLEYIRVSLPSYNLIIDLITHYKPEKNQTEIKIKNNIVKGESYKLIAPLIARVLTKKHVDYIKNKYLYIL